MLDIPNDCIQVISEYGNPAALACISSRFVFLTSTIWARTYREHGHDSAIARTGNTRCAMVAPDECYAQCIRWGNWKFMAQIEPVITIDYKKCLRAAVWNGDFEIAMKYYSYCQNDHVLIVEAVRADNHAAFIYVLEQGYCDKSRRNIDSIYCAAIEARNMKYIYQVWDIWPPYQYCRLHDALTDARDIGILTELCTKFPVMLETIEPSETLSDLVHNGDPYIEGIIKLIVELNIFPKYPLLFQNIIAYAPDPDLAMGVLNICPADQLDKMVISISIRDSVEMFKIIYSMGVFHRPADYVCSREAACLGRTASAKADRPAGLSQIFRYCFAEGIVSPEMAISAALSCLNVDMMRELRTIGVEVGKLKYLTRVAARQTNGDNHIEMMTFLIDAGADPSEPLEPSGPSELSELLEAFDESGSLGQAADGEHILLKCEPRGE